MPSSPCLVETLAQIDCAIILSDIHLFLSGNLKRSVVLTITKALWCDKEMSCPMGRLRVTSLTLLNLICLMRAMNVFVIVFLNMFI